MIRSVYLAGPLGFTEAGRFFHETVILHRIKALGVTVLDPWPASASVFGKAAAGDIDLATANLIVGRQNEHMISSADIIMAILDGSDVDSGTAAEIGFAAALRKPVVGVRSDLRMSGDNSATSINLQVGYFINLSGGTIVQSVDDAIRWISTTLRIPISR